MKERPLQPPEEKPVRDLDDLADEAYERWRDEHEDEWRAMRGEINDA